MTGGGEKFVFTVHVSDPDELLQVPLGQVPTCHNCTRPSIICLRYFAFMSSRSVLITFQLRYGSQQSAKTVPEVLSPLGTLVLLLLLSLLGFQSINMKVIHKKKVCSSAIKSQLLIVKFLINLNQHLLYKVLSHSRFLQASFFSVQLVIILWCWCAGILTPYIYLEECLELPKQMASTQ